MTPDPFDVLETTLGPAARVVPVGGTRVVRTPKRPDHVRGNAVHHVDGLAAADLDAALHRSGERFPTGRTRLVAPWTDRLAAAVETRDDVRRSVIAVLQRDQSAGTVAVRDDLRLSPPSDDRSWHGVTVLQRHAAPAGEDRARGAADERLRWWTDQLRQLADEGRARVLRAQRFGTPVAFGVLHWAPGIEVGEDHAGLAVVAHVTVHPAHRRLGIARTVVEALVTRQLHDFPQALTAVLAEGPSSGPRPTGWAELARLLAVEPV